MIIYKGYNKVDFGLFIALSNLKLCSWNNVFFDNTPCGPSLTEITIIHKNNVLTCIYMSIRIIITHIILRLIISCIRFIERYKSRVGTLKYFFWGDEPPNLPAYVLDL